MYVFALAHCLFYTEQRNFWPDLRDLSCQPFALKGEIIVLIIVGPMVLRVQVNIPIVLVKVVIKRSGELHST